MGHPARKITISDLPPWIPASFLEKERAADPEKKGKIIRVKFRFSKPERKVYRKRKYIRPSKWAEKHRYVTSGPLEGGRWSGSLTPYLVGIMDASFFPSVREIYNCKSPQGGGTVMLETCLGYAADRRPGPAIVVYPDGTTARGNCKDNLQPMIKKSPRLSSLMTGVDDDMASLRIRLATMVIHMGWSGSATSLGNKSAMYLILDEVDKYTETPNKREAATIDLAKKRVTAYPHDSKTWMSSTPTVESGTIWQALITDAQVIFEYWGKCPFCGEHQHIRFGTKEAPGGIKWPEGDKDYNKIENEKLAWYECEHCRKPWNDHMRDRAVRHGEWRAKNDGRELFRYLREERPIKIGFHTPAWISPFVSLSESAARFLKGLTSKIALKDFCNNYAAEPWTDYTKEREENRILALSDGRPPGIVPGGGKVAGLFAGIDTHGPGANAGFYFIIRAYGWARKWTEDGNLVPIPQEKWLIRKGFVTTFEALEQVLLQDKYVDPDGNIYPIQRIVQDAMGHRAMEVYKFSTKYRGLLHPFKGERTMTQPWRFSNIELYPGTNKPIPGGAMLLRANTTLYKSSLASELEIGPGDPGCRWMCATVEELMAANHKNPSAGIDEAFAAHYTSEYVGDDGFWHCPDGKPNHFWDCEEYAITYNIFRTF